ncbi:hypothetical protein [Salinisphaera sp.]|uniref:hypothetical protein n=1 Tax=Salinisphaera sp. TaxID=1914330 RepID=UPI002D77816A|nr:hypothetical protein [Salinisphaera sp.]HET7315416.1 hypothetical protein [Salinisphaera sp.]
MGRQGDQTKLQRIANPTIAVVGRAMSRLRLAANDAPDLYQPAKTRVQKEDENSPRMNAKKTQIKTNFLYFACLWRLFAGLLFFLSTIVKSL